MTIHDEFTGLPKKRAFYRRNKKRGIYLLYAAKKRAKKLGLDFNLEHKDISIPSVCPILGIPIDANTVENGASGKGPSMNSPSLDRIIPEKGYVKDNVRVISFKANKYKNNMSRETLQRLLDYVDGKL